MYKLLSIGLDQSYTRTGIGIAADGTLLKVSSINFRGCTNKSEKRKALAKVLIKIIETNQHKASQVVIICERVRTFSHNFKGKGKVKQGEKVGQPSEAESTGDSGQFISTSYIKATGALIATIVDTAYDYGIPVFSVDTRAWMSKVVGSAKGSNKQASIKFVTKLGFDVSSVNKKGNITYDDDASDSGCIALYAFVPKLKRSLKKEE